MYAVASLWVFCEPVCTIYSQLFRLSLLARWDIGDTVKIYCIVLLHKQLEWICLCVYWCMRVYVPCVLFSPCQHKNKKNNNKHCIVVAATAIHAHVHMSVCVFVRNHNKHLGIKVKNQANELECHRVDSKFVVTKSELCSIV